MPQSWPSALKSSGGTPDTSTGRFFSSSWKNSGSAHTSAESMATYMGMSPIMPIPRSFIYAFSFVHCSKNRYWM